MVSSLMDVIEPSLPYIGTTDTEKPFRYFLREITTDSAMISIPLWLDNSFNPQEVKTVCLHLEGLLSTKRRNSPMAKGSIEYTPSGVDSELLLCRVSFEIPLTNWQLLQKIELEENYGPEMIDGILERIKDSLLLKGGINVYLKHFIPFLTRLVSISPANVLWLKNLMFYEMRDQIKEHIKTLELLYFDLFLNKKVEKTFYSKLNMETLRDACLSEVDSTFLQLALLSVDDTMAFMFKNTEEYTLRSYHGYLQSIKLVEHRLYRNLNDISCIYSCHLKRLSKEERAKKLLSELKDSKIFQEKFCSPQNQRP